MEGFNLGSVAVAPTSFAGVSLGCANGLAKGVSKGEVLDFLEEPLWTFELECDMGIGNPVPLPPDPEFFSNM